jgi:hypothetical protein
MGLDSGSGLIMEWMKGKKEEFEALGTVPS